MYTNRIVVIYYYYSRTCIQVIRDNVSLTKVQIGPKRCCIFCGIFEVIYIIVVIIIIITKSIG